MRNVFFEKGTGKWIHEIFSVTKQYKLQKHPATKLTPIQASLKKNEAYICQKLRDKRKKMKSSFKLRDLVETSGKKNIFSQGDTTNLNYKM